MSRSKLPGSGGSYTRDEDTGKLSQVEKPTRPAAVASRKPKPKPAAPRRRKQSEES